MKRTHQELESGTASFTRQSKALESKEQPLGSLEFAAALNGDDPRTVLKALERFTRTVRRQRRQALSGVGSIDVEEVDDSDSSQEEYEEEMETLSLKKRQKQSQSWMEDTKSYNVPFVGTSVAKGDMGTVVPGEWPTGLLHAYLQSSPLATELTGSSLIPPHGLVHKFLLKKRSHEQKASKQGHRMSQSIYRAYLRALEQLVTAAIPVDKLEKYAEEDFSIAPGQSTTLARTTPKFMTPIIRDRLSGLLELVQNGQGDLAALALRVVAGLAATSVGTARHVARTLNDKLKPGTLRRMLKSPRYYNDKDQGEKKPSETEKKESAIHQEKGVGKKDRGGPAIGTQTACLSLACTLMEWGDATVLSLISTAGSKEKKISPGILYLGLRTGLLHRVFDRREKNLARTDRKYLEAVGRLLGCVRNLLGDRETMHKQDLHKNAGMAIAGLVGPKVLADLLSGGALERLCHVALCSSLSTSERTNPYLFTSEDKDAQPNSAPLDTLEGVSFEGRRLLFPVLSSPERSPFLARIDHASGDDKAVSMYLQQLARALCFLINTDGLIPIQLFVVHCFKTTPLLFPALFRLLALPHFEETFAFLSRLAFISRLIRDAPETPTSALSKSLEAKGYDQLLLWVAPFHLKKSIATKALQSSNALVVAETLKFLIVLLKRFDALTSWIGAQSICGQEVLEALKEAVQNRLPEIQALLALRSRFDPFDKTNRNNSWSSAMVLTGHLCDLLILYCSILPDAIGAVKFDWIKLLPDDLGMFFNTSAVLQLKILQALAVIYSLPHGATQEQKISSSSFRLFLSIMTSTREPSIYAVARKQAIKMISCHMDTGCHDRETLQCLQYEATLWVDGVKEGTIAELSGLLERGRGLSLEHSTTVVKAWKQAFPLEPTKQVCFSPLLTASLCSGNHASAPFSLLTQQVALKCILYHRSPLVLAAMIVDVCSGSFFEKTADSESSNTDSSADSASWKTLYLYSQSLLKSDVTKKNQRSLLLRKATTTLFSSNCLQSIVDNPEKVNSAKEMESALLHLYGSDTFSFGRDGEACLRRCLHEIVSLEDQSDVVRKERSRIFELMQKVLSLVLQDADNGFLGRAIDGIIGHPFVQDRQLRSSELFLLDLLVLSIGSFGQDLVLNTEDVPKYVEKLCCEMTQDIQSSPDAHHSLLSSRASRMKGLSVSMLAPQNHHVLSSHRTMLRVLLGMCCQAVSSPETVDKSRALFVYTLHWMDGFRLTSEYVGAQHNGILLETWQKLIDAKLPSDCVDDEITAICDRLEAGMVNILQESDGLASSFLFSLILQIPPEKLVRTCLASKVASNWKPSQNSVACRSPWFLCSLLQLDCVHFAPSVLRQFRCKEGKKNTIDVRWKSDSVDLALSIMVANQAFQRDPMYYDAVEVVISRVTSILEGADGRAALRRYHVLFEVLPDLVSRYRRPVDNLLKATVTAMVAINEKRKWKSEGESLLIKLAVSLCCETHSHGDLGKGASTIKERLSSLLFIRLCRNLQRSLRRQHQKIVSHCETHCEPQLIADYLLRIVRRVCHFDKDILSNDELSLSGALRACLKYGVGFDQENSVLPATCLRLIRVMVSEAAHDSARLRESLPIEVLKPARIFSMVSAHSKFSLALSIRSTSGGSPDPRLELVRLLLCCVSLSPTRIIFDDDVWKALLAGYNAGVGTVDCTLRRLFHVYSGRTADEGKENELPFMDEFCWVREGALNLVGDGREHDSAEEAEKRWDWFINAIDTSRIRATLSNFPVWDRLLSPPITNVEVWLSQDDHGEIPDGTDTYSSNNYDSTPNSNALHTPQQSTRHENDNAKSAVSYHGEGKGEATTNDNRYSPAFILSMQFATLEWHFMRARLSSSEESGVEHSGLAGEDEIHNIVDDGISMDREAFALVAQRLSDRGGISLALASLSSRCPGLRQLAVAVICLFLRALHLKEANELSAWRDRPQLAMILDSVQRGLTGRRANQKSRTKNPTAEENMSILLPMLPAVSAVFLARSCLVLSKPGDSLFGPLNRFFLKSSEDYGAYQDINRLPAFISLFCSSSDKIGQARRERLWALQQLKDGFVDEYCYGAVAACHAPELLMTFFDSFSSRQQEGDGDLEAVLLLDTLSSIIRHGRHRAARHLFSRIGVLSWLRAVLVGRHSGELLPTEPSRLAFLGLLSVAVENVHLAQDRNNVCWENVIEEVSNLANPVLHLYASYQSSSKKKRGRHEGGSASVDLALSVGDALFSLNCSIRRAFALLPNSEARDRLLGARPQGMLLSSLSQLLVNIPPQSIDKTVASICTLPFCFDPQSSKDASFCCDTMLRFVLAQGQNSGLVGDVMRRVSLLSKLFGPALDPDSALLSLSLRCRSLCIVLPGGIDEYKECVSSLLRHHPEPQDEYATNVVTIARRILRREA